VKDAAYKSRGRSGDPRLKEDYYTQRLSSGVRKEARVPLFEKQGPPKHVVGTCESHGVGHRGRSKGKKPFTGNEDGARGGKTTASGRDGSFGEI